MHLKDTFKVLIFGEDDYEKMTSLKIEKFVDMNNLNKSPISKIDRFILSNRTKNLINKSEFLEELYKRKENKNFLDIFKYL